MRCPDCMKFRSMDQADPEVELDISTEVDEFGNIDVKVTAQAHIALNCCECSTEMKTADIEVEKEFQLANALVDGKNPVAEHVCQVDEDGNVVTDDVPGGTWQLKDGCELAIDDNGSEATSRTEGKGRGIRTFYGFQTNFVIRCSCGKGESLHEDTIEDDVQASGMDEAC